MNFRHLFASLTIFFSLLAVNKAHAVAASFWNPFAAYSFTVAKATVVSGGAIATAGAAKDNDKALVGGIALASGGVILGAVDPPGSLYLDGHIRLNYDSDLFNLMEFGWFEDWGQDSSLLAPPINTALWPGNVVSLQAPNSALSVITAHDVSAGTLEVFFDWGNEGYDANTLEQFFFAGALFEAKTDVMLKLLPFDGSTALTSEELAESNFNVSGNYLHCKSENDLSPSLCSSGTTEYWQVFTVPEPGTVLLLSAGLFGIALRLVSPGLLGIRLRRLHAT